MTAPSQDLLSPELTQDPQPYFASLRREDPVHWNVAGKGWMITRYRDVEQAYGDPRLSSDRVRPLLASLSEDRRARLGPILELISSWMVVTDPPVHDRLRRLANGAFKQQRVAAMGEWIGRLVDDLLDEFVASGSEDFLSGFAYPLPATVIAQMMGAPREDRDRFQRWSDELALVAFGAGGDARPDRHQRALAGLEELLAYLHGRIEQARAHPGDDMVSVLLRGDGEGDHLSDDELAALCALILFAGHETTTNLLCNGLRALLEHPAQLALLRGRPDLVNRAVEEMLRYDGPIKLLVRWVTEDHMREGREIRAGERVFLVPGSANRDPDVFTRPDELDVERATRPLHLGFGRGVHSCLGAQLARVETRVALPRVLDRLPGLRLAQEVRYKPSMASRAVEELRVAST